MLFVRQPATIVTDDSEGRRIAEERGRESALIAMFIVLGIVVAILMIGYFAWWAPMQAQTPVIQHDTRIIERGSSSPPTIVNNPPTVIEHDKVIPVPTPPPANGGSTDNGAGSSSGSGSSGQDNTGSGNGNSGGTGSGGDDNGGSSNGSGTPGSGPQ
ncbi:MAG TPA: hypothetical protein VMI31_16395 [Fimbriimonadaceae bacterium]|nr:hypothetical protein [Fimbriimonadaceae bacterium]